MRTLLKSALLPHVIFIFLGIVLFYMFAHQNFDHSWSDENIHIYVAKRVAEGCQLYGCVDSARPPLVILPLALLIKLGIPPLLAARSLHFLSTVLVALFIWLFSLGRSRSPIALLPFALFMLAPQVLSSTSYTGIFLVTLFSYISVELMLLNRAYASSLLASMAFLSGQHSMVITACVLLLHLLLNGRWAALKFLALFCVTSTLPLIILFLVGGNRVFETLFLVHMYHLTHSGLPLPRKDQLSWWAFNIILDNGLIYILAVLHPVLQADKYRWTAIVKERRNNWSVFLLIAVIHIVVMLSIGESKQHYLLPAVPFLCLAAGSSLSALLQSADIKVWIRSFKMEGVLPVLLVACLCLLQLLSWPLVAHRWVVLEGNEIKSLPYARIIDQTHMRSMELGRRIGVNFSPPTERTPYTIFGHPTLVTNISLHSNMRVSAELADLDPRWLISGFMHPKDVIRRIEQDNVLYFITPKWYYMRSRSFVTYLKKCYRPPLRIRRKKEGERGYAIPDIYFFEHTPGKRPCTID